MQTPEQFKQIPTGTAWGALLREHYLGSCRLDFATDYVASDTLFGLSSSCCPHLRSDLGLETFTFS